MRRLCWLLVDFVALALEPAERTAVRGDLEECEATCGQALIGVADLAVRRQAGLWRDWHPWLALLGVAVLTGHYLSRLVLGFDADLFTQVRTYGHYGVHYEMGVSAAQDAVALACILIALMVWAWTSGFALGSLSGRAAWLTGLLFYGVVAWSWMISFWVSRSIVYAHRPPVAVLLLLIFVPATPAKLTFLLFAAWGAACGFNRRSLKRKQAFALAAAVMAVVALLLWTGGWYEAVKEMLSNGTWHPVPWTTRIVPMLFMSWPAAYLLITSRRPERAIRLSGASGAI